MNDDVQALLLKLFEFLKARDYVYGDKESVSWMVKNMQYPPLTMHRRIAMPMTLAEYQELGKLLTAIDSLVHPKKEAPKTELKERLYPLAKAFAQKTEDRIDAGEFDRLTTSSEIESDA